MSYTFNADGKCTSFTGGRRAAAAVTGRLQMSTSDAAIPSASISCCQRGHLVKLCKGLRHMLCLPQAT